MGIFDKFKKKKKVLDQPIDFGVIGTDIHSHLIPGIDDGSRNMEDSLAMLRALSSLGYKKVVTTPHILSDLYPNTKKNILEGYEKVKVALEKEKIPIELEVASEYFFDDHFIDLIEKDELLSFGDNYILFELSFAQEPFDLDKTIFDLQLAGYTPVIAHPERYSYWHQDFTKYQKLFNKDVILQLNINSLSGYYSPRVQKIAEKLIDNNMIQLIGTDLHHLGQIENLKTSARSIHLKTLLDSGNLLNLDL